MTTIQIPNYKLQMTKFEITNNEEIKGQFSLYRYILKKRQLS